MYARHFDLKQDPFSIAPDPRFLFMSERHREALAHLLFGVSGTGGFVLFTGDIGTGKTTVCRCFLEQMPATCQVAIVFNPKLSVGELLQTICEEFHVLVDTSAEPQSLKSYVDALNVFLLQSHAAGQSSVLIIDEAQNLRPEVLEQLRLLTNLETHERKLLQIVLIGQPELRTMLQQPELEQLSQRVIARYHLEALDLVDTTRYIQHRLAVAGHSGLLPFDEKALRRIYALTRGVPRRINLLCGRSLLGAWANGLHQVERGMVEQAASEVFGADDARPARLRRTRLMQLGAACCVLALVLGLQFWMQAPSTAPMLAAAQAAPAAPPASAVALNPAPPAPVQAPPAPPEDMEALLPQLTSDMAQAWRSLSPSWNVATDSSDPCAAVAPQLLCYRGNDLTVPLLRQLDRPGILTLQGGKQPPVYAVLTGMNAQNAVLLAGGAEHAVSLISLARFWHGEFATYWQPPPGYQSDLRAGPAGPHWSQLSRQLAQLEGRAVPEDDGMLLPDAALVARVRAFQAGQGIKPDGHAGPMTFMQLEKALGSKGPSLQAGAH